MPRNDPDPLATFLQQIQPSSSSLGSTIATGILFLYLLHYVLLYLDYPVLPPQELLWNAIVYILPQQLLLDRARRQELKDNRIISNTHAAKSEALRRMLGIGGSAVLQKLPAEGFMRRASTLGARLQPGKKVQSDRPPGLGNWDNSCYQNSVLQGLASLGSLRTYLIRVADANMEATESTTGSLLETVTKLNDVENNGKQLWTPAKLKSMSSWQQQDAQEYFSKVMDELDKESAKSAAAVKTLQGLEGVLEENRPDATDEPLSSTNPLDGLLAQRVTCTRCGFSEGLSMIPFNCLTLPLGPEQSYDLADCLDQYTEAEEIEGVNCGRCSLLKAAEQLKKMLPSPPEISTTEDSIPIGSKTLELPPELRAQAFQRLAAIQRALEEDDVEDKTLDETCMISKKARVSTVKTRQAVVSRAPKSLCLHVQRSVFDEMTGAQRKNYASMRFPEMLDLGPWMVALAGDGVDSKHLATASLLDGDVDGPRIGTRYTIKAVVTHYGRHENGHYICYRRHPTQPQQTICNRDDYEPDEDEPESLGGTEADAKRPEPQWWRLSDETVSAVSMEEVLAQNGAFMLFYERDDDSPSEAPGIGNVSAAAEVAETEAVEVHVKGHDEREAVAVSLVDSPEHDANAVSAVSSATVDLPTIPTTSPPRSPTPSPKNGQTDCASAVDQVKELDTSPAKHERSLRKSSLPPVAMRTASVARYRNSKDDSGHGEAFGSSRAVLLAT